MPVYAGRPGLVTARRRYAAFTAKAGPNAEAPAPDGTGASEKAESAAIILQYLLRICKAVRFADQIDGPPFAFQICFCEILSQDPHAEKLDSAGK